MKTLETGIVSYFENKFPLLEQSAVIDLTTENGEYSIVANGIDASMAPKLIFLDISDLESKPCGAIRQLTLVDCLRGIKLLSDSCKNELTVYFNKDGIVSKVAPVIKHFNGYNVPKVGANYKVAIDMMISNYQRAIDETNSREPLLLAKQRRICQKAEAGCRDGAQIS
jgi:hypothetical protein